MNSNTPKSSKNKISEDEELEDKNLEDEYKIENPAIFIAESANKLKNSLLNLEPPDYY